MRTHPHGGKASCNQQLVTAVKSIFYCDDPSSSGSTTWELSLYSFQEVTE